MESQKMKTKAAVVGAGLLGRLIALDLAKKGFSVVLFDKESEHSESSCSFAAGGLLTPEIEAAQGEVKVASFGRRAMALWPQLLKSLPEPVFHRFGPSFVCARPQDMEDLSDFRAKLLSRCRISGEIALQDTASLASIDSFFADTNLQGFAIPENGLVDPVALMHVLGKMLGAAKVTCKWGTKVEDVRNGEVFSCDTWQPYDLVFDTRGLGARSDLKDLRGVRGEVIHIEAPELKLEHTLRVLHPRFPVYVVPRSLGNEKTKNGDRGTGANRYIVGATCLETELSGPPTVQSALELLAGIADLHHGFRQAHIVGMKSQHRPAFPDNLPAIVASLPTSHQGRLIRINGLFRHGIMMAPLLADIGVRAALDQPLSTVDRDFVSEALA